MINNFLQPIWDSASSFMTLHPFIGWIIAAILLLVVSIKFLSDTIPQFEVIKSKIIIPFAKKWKFRKLVKEAIKNDIRGHVNIEVGKLQKELPKGWIQKMDIEWVEQENKNDFINDNEAVIRMRPLENQDQNFTIAVYYFFKKVFFPKTKRVIPEIHREASALHMSRRLIEKQKKHLKTIFEDSILEPAVQKRSGILDCLDRYGKIDQRGFFTGTFLREIHEIATQVRFQQKRKIMGSEVAEILKHIEDFIKKFDSDENIPPGGWYRFGPVTSYSFLLIAHPIKTSGGVNPYINRAKEKLSQGADRLYVFGSNKEKWFAHSVIGHIQRYVSGYQLVEKFELYRDYRGERGGIGALFIAKKIQSNVS